MEKTSSFSLIDYKRTIFKLSAWLRQLKAYSETLGLAESTQSIEDILHRVETNAFEIAVVGEFKRGKSTLINALLGREILPSDIVPTTATLNRITYGLKDQVKIRFKNGQEDIIAIDQLHQYVTKLTPEAAALSATVQEAVVYYPIPFCQNNVDIIDTPGLSDEATLTETTMAVLPKVDAAIFVVMAQSPLSDSERFFLESSLLTASLGRILFVVTGIDRCNRPEDVDKVLQSVEARINTHVLKGAEEKFGSDSPEYQGYLSRIGRPKVFGVSAYQALQAKLSGDASLLAQSRFLELETALEKFLSEERGIVFLQVPVNHIISVAKTVLDQITHQQATLTKTNGILNHDYEQAIATLTTDYHNREQVRSQHQQTVEATQQRLYKLVNQLDTNLQQMCAQTIASTPLNAYDFNSSVVSQQVINLDQMIADALETQSRRWAGSIQIELKRGIQVLHESRQPSPEKMTELLNQIGLLCLNLGSALSQCVLQERLAWSLSNEATSGVGGWLNQALRSQDLASEFKTRYQSRIAEAVSNQIAVDRTPQKIYASILTILNPLKNSESSQSEPLQDILSEPRIQLERQKARLEIQLQSLQDMQQDTQILLTEAQGTLAQLLNLMGINSK
jgi:small GTP-binding protein